MSSWRVQSSCTGWPTAFEISAASATKSANRRRPKPPPASWQCTRIFSGASPVTFAACWSVRTSVCVGTQNSAESVRTSAVQFIVSSVACAWKGKTYDASICRADEVIAAAASPSRRTG